MNLETEQNSGFPYWPGMKDELPIIDIMHDDEIYLIKVYVPGLAFEDLAIKIKDDILIIRNDLKENIAEEKTYLHREMFDGRFNRKINLPEDAHYEKIETVVINGILKITIPKKRIIRKAA